MTDPRNKVAYLCGKMRGEPLFNFPLFDSVEWSLAQDGWSVISPARLDRDAGFDPFDMPRNHDWSTIPTGFDLDAAQRRDVAAIMSLRPGTDVVFQITQKTGVGSSAEIALAKWRGVEVRLHAYAKPTETALPGVTAPKPASSMADAVNDALGLTGEVRVTDPQTGGAKGSKPEQCDQIPPNALLELARHYGVGARKYDAHNFRKGYKWSLSYNACMRHLLQFWSGEDRDAETGSKHVIAAAWHCLCLATYIDEHPAKDDRFKGECATHEADNQ
jgi:hypothetical protein